MLNRRFAGVELDVLRPDIDNNLVDSVVEVEVGVQPCFGEIAYHTPALLHLIFHPLRITQRPYVIDEVLFLLT